MSKITYFRHIMENVGVAIVKSSNGSWEQDKKRLPYIWVRKCKLFRGIKIGIGRWMFVFAWGGAYG